MSSEAEREYQRYARLLLLKTLSLDNHQPGVLEMQALRSHPRLTESEPDF